VLSISADITPAICMFKIKAALTLKLLPKPFVTQTSCAI